MTGDLLPTVLQKNSMPLESEKDLDILLQDIGDAKCVFLGEASHGTKEYYIWRAHITKRLIEERNFSFVAVEGDWPDCYTVNRYVKEYEGSSRDAEHALRSFKRWPAWMWANEEVREFIEWMRTHNHQLHHNKSLLEKGRVGFYGLDVYSLWESLELVMRYLEEYDPFALKAAYEAYSCFEPYSVSGSIQGRMVPRSCSEEVGALLSAMRTQVKQYAGDGEEYFNAEQNLIVTKTADAYYQSMIRADTESWNVRDTHMMETLDRLLKFHGEESKAVIWAHNTHIGDARATPMAQQGMINLGQLAREKYGKENVYLVGFSSYEGSVIAGAHWGAPMMKMEMPPAHKGSWEHLIHEAQPHNQLWILKQMQEELAGAQYGQRAIGVVYIPRSERSNYVPTVLADRYNALLYFETTQALTPLMVRETQESLSYIEGLI